MLESWHPVTERIRRVCSSCFVDPKILEVFERRGTSTFCDVCRKECLSTLSPGDLREMFQPLLGLFRPHVPARLRTSEMSIRDPKGPHPMIQRMFDKWKIFGGPIVNSGRYGDLVNSIVNIEDAAEPVDVHGDWDSAVDPMESPIGRWYDFSGRLKYKARYSVDNGANVKEILDILPKDTLEALTVSIENPTFHRARRDYQLKRETKSWARDMTAPPHDKAKAGRANAAGIRVLYAAESKVTAVAEVRAAVGDLVTVAEVKPKKRMLHLIDFTGVEKFRVQSPFGFNASEALLRRTKMGETLGIIASDMSRPVQQGDSPLEYVPTQYVAEYIRARGYDGIRYPSELDKDGVNVVLFEPNSFTFQNPSIMGVASVQYEVLLVDDFDRGEAGMSWIDGRPLR